MTFDTDESRHFATHWSAGNELEIGVNAAGTLAEVSDRVYIRQDIHSLARRIHNMAKPTAKVFKSGNSQAVRLPAEFRFDVDEVFIERDGDKIILSPRPTSWEAFFSSKVRSTDDFMEERIDTLPQTREDL